MAPAKVSDRQLLAARFTPAAPLRALVITLSDRASAGVYEDKSGPKLRKYVEDFFRDGGIPLIAESAILSDDSMGLREQLVIARDVLKHLRQFRDHCLVESVAHIGAVQPYLYAKRIRTAKF